MTEITLKRPDIADRSVDPTRKSPQDVAVPRGGSDEMRAHEKPAGRMYAPPGPRARRIRRFGPMIALSLALIGVVFVVRPFGGEKPNVTASPATFGDIEQTVISTGVLKPVKLVAVGAQVSGRVTSLEVRLNQKVKKGDRIAEIDSLPQQNALRTAEAALELARAQRVEKEAMLTLATSTLARHQALLMQKATSRVDFETTEATVKTTRAQIAALDAQIIQAMVALETARINLGYTRITAPIDGTVLAVVTQEGQTVNAVQSAPTIVILGDLDTMTIRAEISEADIIRAKPGQPVYFTILGDHERRYEASLESIDPAPDSIRNDSSFSAVASSTSSSSSSSSPTSSAIYYNGVFKVPNPDGSLRTYMTAEVHIVLGRAEHVLTIPSAALQEKASNGFYRVQVVDASGAITSRIIQIGLDNKITAEVVSGLKEGERVVTGQARPNGRATSGFPGPPPPMGL